MERKQLSSYSSSSDSNQPTVSEFIIFPELPEFALKSACPASSMEGKKYKRHHFTPWCYCW